MITVVLNNGPQRPPRPVSQNPIQDAVTQIRSEAEVPTPTGPETLLIDAEVIDIDGLQNLRLLDEQGGVVALFAQGSWKYAYPTTEEEV